MQRVARLSFCCLLPLCVHAQTAKKDAKAPAATKPAAPPKATFSDNIVAVFREVQASRSAGAKGEFESTAQYQERLASWKGGTKKYVFVVDKAEESVSNEYTFDYDADAEEMHLTVGEKYLVSNTIQLRSMHTVQGTYVGSNAFGVKRIITRMVEQTYYVELSPSSSPFQKDAYGVTLEPAEFTWIMDPAAARASKTYLRIAVVGTVPSPEATEKIGYREPTLNNPRQSLLYDRTLPFSLEELRVVNSRTGATVASFPAPKPAADHPSTLLPADANLPNYGDPLGKLGPPSNVTVLAAVSAPIRAAA